MFIYFINLFYISRADQHTKEKIINEVGVCQRLVCQKREFTVRSSSCEVYDSKLKNEIDMKHSYFSNYLTINFSVFETVVFAKNYFMFMHMFLYKVTNLTLYMYLCIEIF